MSRLGDEGGFTLTELLVAMTLSIVLLIATLTVLDGFVARSGANVKVNDMQETARQSIDSLARQIRNAAAPNLQSSVMERADAFDLVFDSVDPAGPSGSNEYAVRRIRYCVNQSQKRLWRQVKTWTTATRPTIPATTTCPQTQYGTQTIVADGVVNRSLTGTPAAFTYDSAVVEQITSLAVDLRVDNDTTRAPKGAALTTGIRLRNRNRPPVASFTVISRGGNHVLLNAGASSDPDGQPLEYRWYLDGNAPSNRIPGVTGQFADYLVPSSGSHSFYVTVVDPGGREASAGPTTVNVLP